MINFMKPNRFMPSSSANMQEDYPRFGFNQPLPLPGMQQGNPLAPAPPQSQVNQQPDFTAEYNKILGNRPDKLAYRQAVEQGAPVINRGKWAKLGAALAAGGTALGSGDAVAGTNLGLSSYYEPQRRSDERYQERTRGLGNLANMEDSDVTARIKALEDQRADFFRVRESDRQDIELKNNSKLNEAQIAHINQQMDDAKTDKWTDKMTGISYERNPQGVVRVVGKTDMSASEIATQKGAEAKAEAEGKAPSEQALADKRGNWDLRVANAQIAGRDSLEQTKIKARAELQAKKLESAAKGLKPGDKYAQALINIAAASRSDNSLAEEGLLLKDALGMPVVAPDNWYDGPDTTAAKEKLRGILSTALGEAATGSGSGNAGNTGSGSNQPAAGSNVQQAPVGNRTVKVVAPDGSFSMETPEDAKTMVANGGGQVKIEGAAPAQAAPEQVVPNLTAPNTPPKSIRERLGLRNPPPVDNPTPIKPSGMNLQPGFGTKSFGQILPRSNPIPAGRGPITSIPEQPATGIIAPKNFGIDPNAVIPPHTSPPPNGPVSRPVEAPVQQPNPIQLNQPIPAFNDKLLSVMQKVKAETGFTIKPSSSGRGNAPDSVNDVKVYDKSGKVVTDPNIIDHITAIAAGEGLLWDGKSLRLGR